MSADDDDDYLSDKFLLAPSSSSTKASSYTELRKEAQKKAQLKNEQNRQKGRRQREIESRQEGLSKSLFERAKEEEASGSGSANKALSIMMKMGFKPGQSLGNTGDRGDTHNSNNTPTTGPISSTASDEQKPISSPLPQEVDSSHSQDSLGTQIKHKTEPLPLQEWEGRRGIGLGKRRARSPSAAERMAKMAKMAENMGQRDFRERARDEYNNRRAEGRLVPAQTTCTTLDEQAGKTFNVLWLNPNNRDTFPAGLLEALMLHSSGSVIPERQGDSVQSRLRKQMQVDALLPVNDDADLVDERKDTMKSYLAEDQYSADLLEEAAQFLRLQAQDRLHLVLSYMRDRHFYCFWCGVTYESAEEMQDQCPGSEEDDHD